MKKIMMLGGLSYLIPAIKAAHKHGFHVITVDYIPDNIAHKYSDEYYNISTFDKDAILEVARSIKIDGIISFAVDAGVVSAAYVAEKMGLPFQCSYESACILQDKALFREFLATHGFNTPRAKGYNNVEDALRDIDEFTWPVIVKPVDSCGSKGVLKVDTPDSLGKAIVNALDISHSGHFVVEEFLEKEGLSSGSESFFVNGKLLYNGFYDQYFDNEAVNPYTPSAECWPANKPENILCEVRTELQRLGNLLQIRTGLFNVEWRVCKDGKVYLMEVSPRAGGNRLAEMLNYAADVDIIEAEVLQAVGAPVGDIHEPNYKGCFAVYVLHSERGGVFRGLEVDSQFKANHVVEQEIRTPLGSHIDAFTGANQALGTLFLKFSSNEEMHYMLSSISEHVKVSII